VTVEVRDVPERHRFEVAENGQPAGFLTYRISDGEITFVHTEVDPAFEGKGLAGQLVKAALDDVRGRGLRVIPECPYVRRYIDRHPEYADLVPAGFEG
jgi:predicted GNAT family acetyltransferase